jgi:hypothetical protein
VGVMDGRPALLLLTPACAPSIPIRFRLSLFLSWNGVGSDFWA